MSLTRRMFFSLLAASAARPASARVVPTPAERAAFPQYVHDVEEARIRYLRGVHRLELENQYGRARLRAFELEAEVRQKYVAQIDEMLRRHSSVKWQVTITEAKR